MQLSCHFHSNENNIVANKGANKLWKYSQTSEFWILSKFRWHQTTLARIIIIKSNQIVQIVELLEQYEQTKTNLQDRCITIINWGLIWNIYCWVNVFVNLFSLSQQWFCWPQWLRSVAVDWPRVIGDWCRTKIFFVLISHQSVY